MILHLIQKFLMSSKGSIDVLGRKIRLGSSMLRTLDLIEQCFGRFYLYWVISQFDCFDFQVHRQ